VDRRYSLPTRHVNTVVIHFGHPCSRAVLVTVLLSQAFCTYKIMTSVCRHGRSVRNTREHGPCRRQC